MRPFDRRYERSVAALVALRNCLAEDRPLGGGEGEFLDLYEIVADLHPRHFTMAWTAPVVYAWVREAYRLVRASLAEPADDRIAAAVRHLGFFKAVALAQHWLAARDLVLESPFDAVLPFALPGSGLLVDGSGSLELQGISGDRILARHAGSAMSLAPGAVAVDGDPAIRHVPLVDHAGCRIELNPFALRGPGLDLTEADLAIGAGIDFHAAQRALVGETVSLIGRYAPGVYGQFRDVMRCIALKGPRDGSFRTISSSEAPGAFIASAVPNPHELADSFIHEFHHNRLFFIEDDAAVFRAGYDQESIEDRHYSPWRDDPRPARGLLHAVYVFIPVGSFWFAVLSGGNEGGAADYALDRLLRTRLNLAIGLDMLARSAPFTERGQALFHELKRRIDELDLQVAGAGLPEDTAALECRADGSIRPQRSAVDGRQLSVRSAVAEHIERFDRKREATPWLERLRPTA